MLILRSDTCFVPTRMAVSEILEESEILVKFTADRQKFFESDIDAAISHLWREVLFLIYHEQGVSSLQDPEALGRQALRAINSLGITQDIVDILDQRIGGWIVSRELSRLD